MKKKKLTKREIALRAEAKKELQERGIIPPDKPRLNRKKFAKDVLIEFNETMRDYEGVEYLYGAVGCMVGPDMGRITLEEVGVLKLLKIAIETRKFAEGLKAEGRTQYEVGEYVDKVIMPIIQL